MSTCKACGDEKPDKSFPLYAKKYGGKRRSTCRECVRLGRKKNGLCHCGKKLVDATRCETCRDSHAKNAKKRRDIDKNAALQHYGGCCAYCEEDRPLFLTIDHINNDGAEHRRTRGKGRSGGEIYKWLRQDGYPVGFQTACFSCNCAKEIAGEEELCRVLGIQWPRPPRHSWAPPTEEPSDDAGSDQRMDRDRRQ